MTSRPTQLTLACKEGAEVKTIQGVHLLTLTEQLAQRPILLITSLYETRM